MDSTTIVAWVGLMLSVLLALFEIWKYINDKAKLKIVTTYNQEIIDIGDNGLIRDIVKGKIFWTINIANTGTKNIKIRSVGFTSRDDNLKSLLTKDYIGPIDPFTLVPGDNRILTIPYEWAHPEKVISILANDAIGKTHEKKVKYKK